jgi:hypothetical protein
MSKINRLYLLLGVLFFTPFLTASTNLKRLQKYIQRLEKIPLIESKVVQEKIINLKQRIKKAQKLSKEKFPKRLILIIKLEYKLIKRLISAYKLEKRAKAKELEAYQYIIEAKTAKRALEETITRRKGLENTKL